MSCVSFCVAYTIQIPVFLYSSILQNGFLLDTFSFLGMALGSRSIAVTKRCLLSQLPLWVAHIVINK